MIRLAFKIAALTDSEWSRLIAEASHSRYSHVEGWLDGAQNSALCFSSREPKGASFEIIDLTAPYWEIVGPLNLTAEQEARIAGFCAGANGKEYDGLGLIGYKFGTGCHDDHDLFCSECWAAALKECAGWTLGGKDPWMISP